MKKKWYKIPAFILIATAGVILFSSIVMFLWNSALQPALHVGAITLWQAAGILLLAKILFGGKRRRMFCGPRHNRMYAGCHRTPGNVE